MENELRKHLRNLLTEAAAQRRSVWHKLGNILLEMAIIVFAVWFAVFMERNREHSAEQKEVKEFLLGLKTDLESDIVEMRGDTSGYGYSGQARALRYFARADSIQMDLLKRYYHVFQSETHLLINNGRFEGFKASGKLNTIANVELRNSILDLYQEKLVALTNATSRHLVLKREMLSLIRRNRVLMQQSGDNLVSVLGMPEVKNYCFQLSDVSYIIERYEEASLLSARIIAMINETYRLN